MRKRFAGIMLILSALMIFSAVLASCGPAYDPNAIVIMGKKTDMDKSYMRKIFQRYKDETGKNINLVEINDSKFEAEAAKRFESGEGPDVFFHFNNDDLNRLDVSNNFYMMNDEEWVGDLTASAKNYCSDAKSNLLGLPFWESSVSGCYYNKTLLDQYGLQPAHTQKEFDALCNALLKFGVTPICWPAQCSWMYQFGLDPVFADEPFGPLLLSQLNADAISYSDVPQVKKMVSWIKDAADKGWFGNNYQNIGWDNISGELNSGKAAMVFIWDTWFYTDYVSGRYTKGDFALMPAFLGTVDGGTYEGGNLNMMMVNKNSEKLTEALEFVRFCATSEHYNYAFEDIPTVSVFKGQTTNIQSHMVTDPETSMSILLKERVSTAATKISGYSADDVASAFVKLFKGEVDVDGCIELLESMRRGKQ